MNPCTYCDDKVSHSAYFMTYLRTKYEALGSDYEPEKALGSDYEWKNEI